MPLALGSYTTNRSQPLTVTATGLRAGLVPMPLALINREIASPHRMTTLAVKLYHALVFLSWNLLQTGETIFPCPAKSLRGLVGRPGQTSNADLDDAFEQLRSTSFKTARRDDPAHVVTAPILQDHGFGHVAGNRICWWRFDDSVVAWCGSPGVARGWLDLRQTSRLGTVAALRLYELASALAPRSCIRSVTAPIPDFKTFFELGKRYEGYWSLEHRFLKPTLKAVADATGLVVMHDTIMMGNLSVPTKWKLTATRGAPPADTGPTSALPLTRDDLALLPACTGAIPIDRGPQDSASSEDGWAW